MAQLAPMKPIPIDILALLAAVTRLAEEQGLRFSFTLLWGDVKGPPRGPG